jgi:hypothetical protein
MKSAHYEITVRGRLGADLIDAFDGLTASSAPAHTVLGGELADQAALYGVLDRIESLGLELLEVRRRTASNPNPQGGFPCHPC